MLETVIEPLLEGVALPTFKAFANYTRKQLDQRKFSKEEKEKFRQFAASLNRYHSEYKHIHGYVKDLGMTKPQSIEDIYVNVHFLKQWPVRPLLDSQAIEFKLQREQKIKGFKVQSSETVSGLTVAEKNQYLCVFGSPGSGKSTFLKRIGIAEFKYKGKTLLPIFIELRNFQLNDNLSLENYIESQFNYFGVSCPQGFVENSLESGDFLILLDGLDEICGENAYSIYVHIRDFIRKYSENKFVVSCRTAARERYIMLRFTDVVIAEFNDEQVEKAICKRFPEGTRDGVRLQNGFLSHIRQPRYSSIDSLTRIPLFLSYLCSNYKSTQSFPKNQSLLYKKIVSIVLQEWNASKVLEKPEILNKIEIELEEWILSAIAFRGFKADKLTYSETEILHQISTITSEVAEISEELHAREILKSFVTYHGILEERAEQMYAFSHATLQDYLAAYYVYKSSVSLDGIVENYIFDSRWKDFFVLIAGLLGQADSFLLTIENKVREKQETSEIVGIISEWAQSWSIFSRTYTQKNFLTRYTLFLLASVLVISRLIQIIVAKDVDNALVTDFFSQNELECKLRVVNNLIYSLLEDGTLFSIENRETEDFRELLFIGVRLARDISGPSVYRDCIKNSMSLAEKLAHMKILSERDKNSLCAKLKKSKIIMPRTHEPVWRRQSFIVNVADLWFKSLNLRIPNLEDEYKDAESFVDYLAANLLLIECKNSSTIVSKNTWNGIQNRMFR